MNRFISIEHHARFQILLHLVMLIIVDNIFFERLQSPEIFMMWLQDLSKGNPNITLEAAETASSTLPLFGFFILATLFLWIFKKRIFMYIPLVLYLIWTTILLIVSVIILTVSIFNPHSGAEVLLSDGMLVWLSNIIVFSVWYWLLDHYRQERKLHDPNVRTDLVFPQNYETSSGWKSWIPGTFDYIYVAFITSTQFGPSDTVFLTQRSKILNMIQSAIALVITGTIAARAVGLIK